MSVIGKEDERHGCLVYSIRFGVAVVLVRVFFF